MAQILRTVYQQIDIVSILPGVPTSSRPTQQTEVDIDYGQPQQQQQPSIPHQLDKGQLFSVDTHRWAQRCTSAHFRYLLRHNRKWRLVEGSTSLSLVSGCHSLGSRTMLMVEGQARRCRLLDGDVTFFQLIPVQAMCRALRVCHSVISTPW